MGTQKRRKPERRPPSEKRDKNPVRYRRTEPRSRTHRDRYLNQAPGGRNRSHRSADGRPKRQLSEEGAIDGIAAAARNGVHLRAYVCPVCGNWHLATMRPPQIGHE